jgi:DNA-binding beta-propeller fold protein YncE
MRSPATSAVILIAAAAAAVTVAGCSGSAPGVSRPATTSPAPGRPATSSPAPNPVTLAGHGRVSTSLPGCTTATQDGPQLSSSLVSLSAVPPTPFGVAVRPDGLSGFATLGQTVGVVQLGTAGPARLSRSISVSRAGSAANPRSAPAGAVLTPGGTYLLAVNNQGGALIISTAAAQDGLSPIVGSLSLPASAGSPAPGAQAGAIEVAVTPDGRFAFVSEEVDDQIAVFDLQRALAGHFGSASYVGAIPMQIAPVGMAVSPDGRWLYATSEGMGLPSPVGSLSVISVARAETDPADAVVTRVPAGCNPVRVVTSANGQVVWVTARASDALLAFSAAKLDARAPDPLLASARVGESPVGLALARAGQLVVVADSNRFNVPGAHASLAVIDVADMLAGRPALLGYLPAGQFPRDIAADASGSVLLVADFGSDQLETVRLDGLP